MTDKAHWRFSSRLSVINPPFGDASPGFLLALPTRNLSCIFQSQPVCWSLGVGLLGYPSWVKVDASLTLGFEGELVLHPGGELGPLVDNEVRLSSWPLERAE